MNAEQIRAVMNAAGAVPMFLEFVLDREYACPDEDYIRGDFAKWFWAEQYRRGVAVWRPEANDCDNFSVRAFADMGLAHSLTSPGSNKGLAFGLFFYQPDGSQEYHAICFAIVKGPDGNYRVVFFEPQPEANTFGLVQLTQTEIKSCVGYLLC